VSSEDRPVERPSGRQAGSRSCGGGCLRTVVGFAIIIGLLFLLAPLRAQIVARLQAPDYATGMIAEGGRLPLYFFFGVLFMAVASVATFTSRQRGAAIGSALLAVGFLALSLWFGAQTWLDLVSTPATVRGTVTSHVSETSPKGTTFHYVDINGIRYQATDSAYRQTAEGRCAVLTYGPRTKVATAATPCVTR